MDPLGKGTARVVITTMNPILGFIIGTYKKVGFCTSG